MYLKSAKKHVIAALLLPGFVMILEAGALLREQFSKYRALENSRDYAYITSQAGYIASFVLPQESTATTAYQMSGSEFSAQVLEKARAETDHSLATVLEMLAQKIAGRQDMVFAIQEIWNAAEALKRFRQQADQESLSADAVIAAMKPFSKDFLRFLSVLRYEMGTPEATRQINLFLDTLDANDASLQALFYSDKYLRGEPLSRAETQALAGFSAILTENIEKLRSYPESRTIGATLAFNDTSQGKWLADLTGRIEANAVVPSDRLYERWQNVKAQQMQALRKDLDESSAEIRSIGDAMAAEARFQFTAFLLAGVTLFGAVLAALFLAAKSVRFIEQLMRDREQLIGELQKAAHTDLLTGLLNRRGFDVALTLRPNTRLVSGSSSVMIFDLDKFKHINDSHGHDVGDLVLQKTAEIARKLFRFDDLLARHGGEEFVGFVSNVSLAEAADLANRIREALERSEVQLENGESLRVTASFGCARIDGSVNRASVHDALKRADQALYAAKSAGRNRVICDIDIEPIEMLAKPAA